MRYIGGKSHLLPEIQNLVSCHTSGVNKIIDLFSGSGVVASHFKSLNFEVIGNDFLYFAYVLSQGSTALNKIPTFEKLDLGSPIDYLNNLTFQNSNIALEDCFIYKNYSPHENISRMYFQNDNALKIDIVRLTIEHWKNQDLISGDEYFFLLAALISAVPYVSNIAGVYGAYLKYWDKRTFNSLKLINPTNIFSNGKATFYNQDSIIRQIRKQQNVL